MRNIKMQRSFTPKTAAYALGRHLGNLGGMDSAGDVIGTYQDSTGSWQGFMAIPVTELASFALARIGLMLIPAW